MFNIDNNFVAKCNLCMIDGKVKQKKNSIVIACFHFFLFVEFDARNENIIVHSEQIVQRERSNWSRLLSSTKTNRNNNNRHVSRLVSCLLLIIVVFAAMRCDKMGRFGLLQERACCIYTHRLCLFRIIQ